MSKASERQRSLKRLAALKADPVAYQSFISDSIQRKRERVARRNAQAGPVPSHCPICQDPFSTGQKQPVWDHCHQGGHFRAWICSACNKGLGIFKDDPERLRRAAEYLTLDRARNPLPPVLLDPDVRRKI